MNKNSLHTFLTIGIYALLAILLFNSFFVFSFGKSLDAKIDEAKELARPAKIEIIKLESSCSDCFDVDSVIEIIKKSNIEIVKEQSLPRNSKATQEIIDMYGIEKLPTVILKGEINKPTIQNFKKVDDALVFDAVSAPYEDTKTNNVIGNVSSIIIGDKSCDVCIDFNLLINNLKQNGVFIGNEEKLDFSESAAKGLISNFVIEKLPAVLLSEDLDAYPEIAQSIKQSASQKKGYYVLESQAPYVETPSGKLRGLANLTLINDSSCSNCYDVKIHKSVLGRFGIAIGKENQIDIKSTEGKQLISRYNIKNVPTIVLTGDLEVYKNLNDVWKQVGTVETDGAYVFREIAAMGKGVVYKDVSTNEIKGLEPASEIGQQQ